MSQLSLMLQKMFDLLVMLSKEKDEKNYIH